MQNNKNPGGEPEAPGRSVTTSTEDPHLLAKVATLYYKFSLTQKAIADRLNVSVMTASRLLDRARRTGVVTITVHTPFGTVPALEARLREAFGLRTAVVLENPYGEDRTTLLGRAAAFHLDMLLTDRAVVGMTAGRTAASMVRHLQSRRLPGLRLVQLIGSLGLVDQMNPFNLIQRACEQLNAQGQYFIAPAYARSPEERNALLHSLLQQSNLAELWEAVSLIVLGIGVATEKSIYVETGFITPSEMARLDHAGAVGDLLGHFFDERGVFLDDSVNRRVMGMPVEKLWQVERVIAAAGGREKVRAIRGALRTGCLAQLITDEETAQAVLHGL
jgi:DNA-binding transcriptional regulator LsrR (DeoR family)